MENGFWVSRVTARVKHTVLQILQWHLGDLVIEGTPGHLVWSVTRRGWVRAHELQPGEFVRPVGNLVVPVESVGPLKTGLVEVYGIEVEFFHNYFVGRGENAMLVHNGPECVVKPMEAEAAEQLPESVRFRIARGDAREEPLAHLEIHGLPTLEEFNPRIGEVRAGDLAETIVARKHAMLPEQAQRVGQLGNEELIRFRVGDPISATRAQNGLSLTGGHHRTNEIIQRVRAGQSGPKHHNQDSSP